MYNTYTSIYVYIIINHNMDQSQSVYLVGYAYYVSLYLENQTPTPWHE